MSCEIFQVPPGGQETFCETKRHLAVAKATEILIIKLEFQLLNKKWGGGCAAIRFLEILTKST
ncbi:MAG: hypothetical protein JWQ79_4255, partial [Mucilaginibacter sp.]|nr:hypothetical protein [Mucilaginibacter sp.]